MFDNLIGQELITACEFFTITRSKTVLILVFMMCDNLVGEELITAIFLYN